MLLMALVGLALIAYFTANPDMFGDNQSLTNNSDQLFPRFISKGLPVGLTGLVISGLLAAAMSSLSSGMNSTSSVITSDFISRLRSGEPDEKSKIVIARWVSVLIGLVVVALSLIVDQVSGNLFEVANKVVNLFVSPLFVLFFPGHVCQIQQCLWSLVRGFNFNHSCGVDCLLGRNNRGQRHQFSLDYAGSICWWNRGRDDC